jgi:hypothetical protein
MAAGPYQSRQAAPRVLRRNRHGSKSGRAGGQAGRRRCRCGSDWPNSVPAAMTRSASAINARTAFRLGLAGTPSGWRCSRPRALAVWTTGAPSLSARRCNGASALLAPPPARTSGRRAAAQSFAASAISAGFGSGGATFVSKAAMPPAGLTMISVGISMCTGPGRDDENRAKARARTPGSSSASVTRCENSATFSIIPRWSGSSCRWPRPLPSVGVALTPEITSIGTESARAWPMAVMVLVSPGPVMTNAMPGLPPARA